MSIPDDAITEYPANDAIIIDDPRVFRGVLTAAEVWGANGLDQGNDDAAAYIDEVMAEFADKIGILRDKYEVHGDALNGESELEDEYFEELNALLATYRRQLFEGFMEYVSNDEAIEWMLELLRDENKQAPADKQ